MSSDFEDRRSMLARGPRHVLGLRGPPVRARPRSSGSCQACPRTSRTAR